MRGNTWTVVALFVGVAMLPAVLDVDVSGDATGQTVESLVGTLGPVVPLAAIVACFGLLIALFTSDGF